LQLEELDDDDDDDDDDDEAAVELDGVPLLLAVILVETSVVVERLF